MASQTPLKNVSHVSAHGVEWESESGALYRLTLPKGSTCLMWGAQFDAGTWDNVPIINPSRYGLKGPCRSFEEFEVIARLYVDGPPPS